jgi:hypothetical protein
MKRPGETYFPSVRLFDDLPVVHGLQGVKEKFLVALGVRKTVELGVIFERLLNAPGQSDSQGKWSHVDLIRYLASVSNDIPASDVKRLKDTSFCMAESRPNRDDSKTLDRKRYKVQELFEPSDSFRVLELPVIEWPGAYMSNSTEGKFLARLGLRSFPAAAEVIRIMVGAAESNDWALHRKAISYYVAEFDANHYGAFDCRLIAKNFLPIEHPSSISMGITSRKRESSSDLPVGGQHAISVPSKCYTDEGAALFGFDILRRDLHRHALKFGVKQHPKLSDCLEILIRNPPSTKSEARLLFRYLAGRVSELSSPDIDLIGKTEIVPVLIQDERSKKGRLRRVAPRVCYLGEGEDYKDLFDFVDFGQEANLFLMAVGSKREPTKVELAQMVVKEPARISSTFQSAEKYLKLLRTSWR